MPNVTARKLVRLAIALLSGLSAALLGSRVTRFRIVEQSMAPALSPGDYLVTVRLDRPPSRGDIVIFDHPRRPGFELAKRVIGLPGETIRIADGRVLVDGAPLLDPWAHGATGPEGEWRLGGSEVFVLGDRRSHSTGDGRSLGPLPVDRLGWRAVGRYWPPGRIGRIGRS